MTEALDSLTELAQRDGGGRISLGDAIALARALGIKARLLCGTDRVRMERFIVLATSDSTPVVSVRGSGERNADLLERGEQVDGDEWEYAFEEVTLRLTLWLELDGGAKLTVELVRLPVHEFSLLDAHGWREDWADLFAEPRVWVATFLTGVARVLGVTGEEVSAIDLTAEQGRRDAARRAGELLRGNARAIIGGGLA